MISDTKRELDEAADDDDEDSANDEAMETSEDGKSRNKVKTNHTK